ncbi:MAG: 30S ribosomal protein S2 [Candidatus Nealsonbacteria bacterium]|nr:30S ribosomal protein S2 [Candidatus Nealsonbacteria bacterium]
MTQTKEELDQKQHEMEEMVKVGVHLGHKKNKKHPKMEPYLYGLRNDISIIDVEKTYEKLEEALSFIKSLISQDKVVMVIGTKVQLKEMVTEFAKEVDIPYMTERWLGGTFTNFGNIKKRVDHLKDLEKKKEEGDLEKYTKKERLNITREIESLKVKFEGLKSLSKLPDAVLVMDIEKDGLAVKEASERGIKVIAISDSNVNPEVVDYPIPANDDAVSSVRYILEKIKGIIIESRVVR